MHSQSSKVLFFKFHTVNICRSTLDFALGSEQCKHFTTSEFSLCSSPAPTGRPQSFTVIHHAARNMTFSWSPPVPTERNGVIIGYFLSCVPECGGRSSISMQYTAAGTFILGGFTPATSYNCSISASNSQGSGPAAYIINTTLEARE